VWRLPDIQALGAEGLTAPQVVPGGPEPLAKPRVTAIIVSRNRKELLQQLLESLGNAHQVIVVDNGSSDGVAALEPEFPSARFIRLPKNFGLTKALNLGMRGAEGDYLLLLHDDAQISAEGVSQLADLLEANPDVGAVAPIFEGTPQWSDLPSPAHPYPEWHTAEGASDRDVPCVSGAALMLRHQFIRAMRQVDERYGQYGSDADLCAQVVRRASKKVRIACNVKALHHVLGKEDSLLAADREIGTVVFLGKYYGFWAGMKYRIGCSLKAMFTFRLAMAKYLLSNQKLDGTQE
jgi:GT2 family glycosyltransferase